MKLKSFILTLFFVTFFSFFSVSQSLNRLNKKGERTGKWITYIDDGKKIKSFEGKFRNGLTVGKSFYYDNSGVLDRIEVKRFKKLKTTFYNSNGKVRLKGKARLENLPDKIHYYFYGTWKSYDDSGKLFRYDYYQKGKLLNSKYLKTNKQINDSLIRALKEIDTDFSNSNIAFRDSINSNLNNAKQLIYFKSLLKQSDSIAFSKIDQILSIYGYPSKDLVDDAVSVPFFILSYAPVVLREKHYNTILLAMNKGDIKPSAFAFFVDKLKVAKGQKQIYGTQYHVDKDYNEIYYPVEDPENLEKRRASMGLD